MIGSIIGDSGSDGGGGDISANASLVVDQGLGCVFFSF